MFGAGFIFEMNSKIRGNAALKKRRIEQTAKIKDLYQEELKNHHVSFQRKDISSEKMAEVKKRIRQKMKKERRIRIVIIFSIAVFVFIILYGLMF